MWVVLLEVDGAAGDEMDVAVARSILDAIADDHPAALHSRDRVAFQAWVRAATAAEALETTAARWAMAAQRSDVRGWQVVRAEVLTPEEFEHDCDEPDVPVEPVSVPPGRTQLTPPTADEEELLRRAFHDPLTQLADPELFRAHVEHAVVRRRAPDSVVAVLYFDLDDFRWVNRSLGARAGDEVLMVVARRIAACVRPADTAARMGGDRFAVLVEETSRPSTSLVADRILEAIRAPHHVAGREVVVTASVGVAFSPPADRGDDLIANAEAAMRSAKQLGTGRPAMFDPDAAHPTGGGPSDPERRPETIAYVGLLQRAATVADECETLEEAAAILLEEICTHTGWSIGRLLVRDPESPHLTTPVLWSIARDRQAETGIGMVTSPSPGDIGLGAQVVATRQPAWRLDVSGGDGSPPAGEGAGMAIRTSFAVPVLVGHDVVAVLEFLTDRESEPDPSLVEVVASVGVQLGRIVERNRASAAVAAAEARLRAVVEACHDVVAVVGEDGTVVAHYEAPEALASASGEPSELLLDRIHPDDLPTATAHLDAVSAAPGGRRRFRCRVRQGDGSWKWMELLAHSLLDHPAVRGILLTVNRVANSDDAFERLHHAKRLARLGTWRFDVATGKTEWSEELYAILGLSPDDTVADLGVFLGAIHPEDRSRVVDAIEQRPGSEDPFSVEFRIVRPDGTLRRLQGTGSKVRDAAGQVVVEHGVTLDVTERQDEEEEQEEAALAVMRARWRELLKDSGEILTLVGEDGRVLFSLAPDGGPFAPAADWEHSVTVTDLVHPDDYGRAASLLWRALSSSGPVGPAELRVRCANGSWRWVESVAYNLLDDPLVGAIVVNSRDVTKRLEEELAEGSFADAIRDLPRGAVVGDGLAPPPTLAHH